MTIKAYFICSCEFETADEQELATHLQENQDHSSKVKYHWIEG